MIIDGTYNIAIDTQMGRRGGTLTLRTDGDSLSGTLNAEGSESNFADGTISDNEVVFSVQLNIPIGSFEIHFKATVTEDGITGQADIGGFGSFPFSGTRN